MKRLKIIFISKKIIYLTSLAAFFILILSVLSYFLFLNQQVNIFVDPKNGVIVVDPGHGGIDGGANADGLFEKEINLSIALKLREILKQKGYKVIMTREEDVALDGLDNSSQSRHRRDLNARINIINHSNAQLFVSIHVDSNIKKPSTDGSIVFYSENYRQNKILAYSIQRKLNNIIVNEKKRTIHDPQQANYYILDNSKVPGVIIETAFISNETERKLLAGDDFRGQLAKAIADGVEGYLNELSKVFAPEQE